MRGLTGLIDDEHVDIAEIGAYLDGLDASTRWSEVSRHASIGAAFKGERPLDHYFVLCRRDRA